MASEAQVVIADLGMVTPVGLSVGESVASVRAGTARFLLTDWRDRRFEPFTVAEVIEGGLDDLEESLAKEPDLTFRELRLLRLASRPFRECVSRVLQKLQGITVLLALPEVETGIALDRGVFLSRLERQVGHSFDSRRSIATFRGRAGGIAAIGDAVRRIRGRELDFVLVGGIDSYRDPYLLATLDLERRVKTSEHLDGFIPGEGAGFVLLASREAATKVGIASLASVYAVTEGFEEGHLYSETPYLGEGLARAFRALFESTPREARIDAVYSSMNGESHWAKEWGVGYVRNPERFSSSPRLHHPADCWGDTGAACAPLLVALAVRALPLSEPGTLSLVYCSSDRGQRAALTLGVA